ncbi:hypothetical protein B0H14DRAFT_2576217 [Mycena olivaceomarginata]|nr:hypothetical protein B0H14DRAFT_2576217 [Mycena olivaceomarginata]
MRYAAAVSGNQASDREALGPDTIATTHIDERAIGSTSAMEVLSGNQLAEGVGAKQDVGRARETNWARKAHLLRACKYLVILNKPLFSLSFCMTPICCAPAPVRAFTFVIKISGHCGTLVFNV